jgi:TrmH family RNA methyltransferase
MITSTSNEQIKMIRKLKDRKYRSETGLFFLEGIRIVIEALNSRGWISQLIVARELLNNDKAEAVIANAQARGIPILEVTGEVFHSISGKDGPQGLAAIGRQKWANLQTQKELLNGIWIALYQVADPGNLGTILRTLDGMGGKGVFLLDHCTDPYDPSAIRASMGALFSKQLVKMDSSEFIDLVNEKNIPVVGTSDAAKVDYREYHYSHDMVLLMGSEREGLPDDLANVCNSIVSIPMLGTGDSLNLAVASAVVLYEIASQLKLVKLKDSYDRLN